MTGWNYRVIKTSDNESSVIYQIIEVYFDDDGAIEYWSAKPDAVAGEDLEGLKDDLLHQLEALDKPVLAEHDDGGRVVLVETGSE
ncbi:hypothetical protein [Endozoicomonas sp. SCSIO W0465]|uniref:hypothetical protein n=1 Tax=Endozoicomonas sp. SCSIO W0465 TaxID=2918516 RepID=UPI0020754EF9|nr:hypothetical protein [Endozoicomonas sp. SCSIO W0465]USE39217.1 hypothetical protein MJO57_14290 [Endozoicomonas sp. SCSIO W0465]